jgi:hypothetical protein
MHGPPILAEFFNCPEGATFPERSLGKTIVPYFLVFCHKSKKIFFASCGFVALCEMFLVLAMLR